MPSIKWERGAVPLPCVSRKLIKVSATDPVS
jgi:hypothetical protein